MTDRRNIAFVNERMLLGFGVDLVIHEVATELANRGHDVTVYASVVDRSVPRNYRLDTIPTRASGAPPRYQAAARPWAEYIDVHGHDLVFVESYPFFSLIPHLKTPSVAVDHGVSSTEGMSRKQRLAFKYIEWTQQNRYFPRATGLVTVSEYIRGLLPNRLRERAQVIYNGGDHYASASQYERDAMRARLGIPDDRVMMLYVGRLNPEGQPYKGTADLMRMMAHWKEHRPDIAVVMAGRGDAADAARIRQSGGVPLLDVPEEEMGALYAAADVYLTASRWEGFDLPLMEAAHQGVPSAALNIGAHPEIVRDGETGVLANDVTKLREAAETLATDHQRRRAMGDAARQWAQRFTWPAATDGYERVIAELAGVPRQAQVLTAARSQSESGGAAETQSAHTEPNTATGGNDESTDVTAVVLNYGANYDILHKCIASLVTQTYRVHTLLVDNDSPKNKEAVDQVENDFPEIEVLKLDKNYGFAGGMNRGVAASNTQYIFLFNNDASLAPNAIEEMRKLIEGKPDVVGIAPKIMLEEPEGFIDAIGNLVDPIGQAFNMGIGQLDVGQYDRIERTFGACFAAALLRSEAWRFGIVGPMDEKYFMYYEDVDWCFRAGIMGYTFLTCPTALVRHQHSMSTRQLAYGYKYRLIMRNFIRTLIKDFQGRRAYKLAVKRCIGMVRNIIRGPHRWASMLVLKDTAFGFIPYVMARRKVQGRRKVEDWTLFNFAHGEQGFFDPTGYAPMRRLEALAFIYNRKFLVTGEERYRRIAEAASALANTRMRFDLDFVRGRLAPLIADEPKSVHDFVNAPDFL